MVHCCVPGCVVTGGKKRFSNAIKIYSLPSNPQRASLWLKAVPRDWKRSNIKTRSIGVCSLHFVGSKYHYTL